MQKKYGRLLKRVFSLDNTIMKFMGKTSEASEDNTCSLRHFHVTGKQQCTLPQLLSYLQLESPTHLLYMLLCKI